MARVTDEQVREIKTTSLVNLSPFIDTSDMILDDLNENCGKSFTEEQLCTIALWLTAHFLSVSDPLLTKEKFENAENTYQRGNAFLAGILSTQYGQMANTLSGGCLVEMDKQDTQVDRA